MKDAVTAYIKLLYRYLFFNGWLAHHICYNICGIWFGIALGLKKNEEVNVTTYADAMQTETWHAYQLSQ